MGPVVSERNQKQVITASLICQRKLNHQLLSEPLNGCFQKLHRCPVLLWLGSWERKRKLWKSLLGKEERNDLMPVCCIM